MGTILRTADSLGIKQIVVSKGTADIYNPKVVRSTMGAIFRVKVIMVDDLKKLDVKYIVRGARFEPYDVNNEDYGQDMIVNSAQALELPTNNAVLVVVDVNKPSITECPELLKLCKSIVVLDHHSVNKELLHVYYVLLFLHSKVLLQIFLI